MDKEKLKNIPDLPGVYTIKDSDGGILYIGKAASLEKRIYSGIFGGIFGDTSLNSLTCIFGDTSLNSLTCIFGDTSHYPAR